MAKRVPVLYITTTGIRKLFQVLKPFSILSVHARRRSQDEKTVEKIAHLGLLIGSKKDSFLTLNHNNKLMPLEVYENDLLGFIDKYGLRDVTVDSIEVMSNTPLLEGVPSELWLRFEAEQVKDEKLRTVFDNDEYNVDLMKLTRKRLMLRLTTACTKHDFITFPPSKRHYLTNLKPNFRDHDGNQSFFEEHIAYELRNAIGKDEAIVVWFKQVTDNKLVIDRVN